MIYLSKSLNPKNWKLFFKQQKYSMLLNDSSITLMLFGRIAIF